MWSRLGPIGGRGPASDAVRQPVHLNRHWKPRDIPNANCKNTDVGWTGTPRKTLLIEKCNLRSDQAQSVSGIMYAPREHNSMVALRQVVCGWEWRYRDQRWTAWGGSFSEETRTKVHTLTVDGKYNQSGFIRIECGCGCRCPPYPPNSMLGYSGWVRFFSRSERANIEFRG